MKNRILIKIVDTSFKTANTKKYGRETMKNNAVSLWNKIQKRISSHVI